MLTFSGRPTWAILIVIMCLYSQADSAKLCTVPRASKRLRSRKFPEVILRRERAAPLHRQPHPGPGCHSDQSRALPVVHPGTADPPPSRRGSHPGSSRLLQRASRPNAVAFLGAVCRTQRAHPRPPTPDIADNGLVRVPRRPGGPGLPALQDRHTAEISEVTFAVQAQTRPPRPRRQKRAVVCRPATTVAARSVRSGTNSLSATPEQRRCHSVSGAAPGLQVFAVQTGYSFPTRAWYSICEWRTRS